MRLGRVVGQRRCRTDAKILRHQVTLNSPQAERDVAPWGLASFRREPGETSAPTAGRVPCVPVSCM